MNYLIILPVLTAFILGTLVSFIKFENNEKLNRYALASTFAISIISFAVLFMLNGEAVTIFAFNDILQIAFKVDGLSVVFAALVSFLWPLAVMYATEYMKHEGKQVKFFTFYIATFGVTLAIAFSANMLTMYLSYELLTLITLPLVNHAMDARSRYAGRKYLVYSVGGASLSFMGMMLLLYKTGSLDFVFGGLLKGTADDVTLFAYLLMFVGFGVKAAVFPLHGWLPAASVAPTTVTALLHAVAVVNAGVFAIMRTTYFFFGTQYLQGTWVQNVAMIMAITTICFGSWMALRSKHFKRRLAYSTVSQLSYMLFGISLMSTAGFTGALAQMVMHGLMKIVLFYTAGVVLFMNHKEYIKDVEGCGKKMPLTFMCFTISSLALIGVPPLAGFFSKFTLATAAASTQSFLGFVGIGALMFSALFTAMYLLQIVVLAYLPHKDFDYSEVANVKEAPKAMTTPMIIITAAMVVLSCCSKPLFAFFELVAKGGF